jgi:hypothetical protein
MIIYIYIVKTIKKEDLKKLQNRYRANGNNDKLQTAANNQRSLKNHKSHAPLSLVRSRPLAGLVIKARKGGS